MLKNSEEEQLVYYQVCHIQLPAKFLPEVVFQQGIGTYTPKIPGIKEPVRIPGLAQLSQA